MNKCPLCGSLRLLEDIPSNHPIIKAALDELDVDLLELEYWLLDHENDAYAQPVKVRRDRMRKALTVLYEKLDI